MTRKTAGAPAGKVVFVGAGPGDPGLLTIALIDGGTSGTRPGSRPGFDCPEAGTSFTGSSSQLLIRRVSQ